MKKTKPVAPRFFIDFDNDGHTYLIPADKRQDWEEWLQIPWVELRETPVPKGIRVIDSVSSVTFIDPIEGAD